jgi:hypothetical protein
MEQTRGWVRPDTEQGEQYWIFYPMAHRGSDRMRCCCCACQWRFPLICPMTSNEAFAACNKIWVSNLSEPSLFSHRTESLLGLIMNDITSPSDFLCRRATHEHHAARRTSYQKMFVANSLTNCPASRPIPTNIGSSSSMGSSYRDRWRISAPYTLGRGTHSRIVGV